MLSRTCRSNLVGEVVHEKLSYVNLSSMVSETVYAEMLSQTRRSNLVGENVFQNAKLEQPDKILCGPDRNPLKTIGKFKANIEYKGKSCTEEIYVISNLQACLLGKPALFSLGSGPNLNSICQISAADPKAKFPELFKGLGVMKGYYSIKLKPGAIPFTITSPRRVPIPLLK
ncbi:hypothetical protein AVEN_98797-1 [Araneus ventricosus]|uniref:Uncharacterized protein n=1 Tax=Araneus ventricosus TaxID=182803 RepID=A0A4Y2VUZ9_ARAVE|nr:hypothetical protein AVEN_98797-1 [Araneus ventricosus]